MKCPVCTSRKGKRSCPALDASICSGCCGEHRLGKIRCPEDCPYLQGEFYQLERRTERARVRGKKFLASLDENFADEAMRQLAWLIHADVCWWTDRFGPRTNAELAEDLDRAGRGPSRVVVPGDLGCELPSFLAALVGASPRHAELRKKHALDDEKIRKTFERLASQCRRQGPAPGTSFLELSRSFFGELDHEADLDYSPLEELAEHEVGAALRERLGTSPPGTAWAASEEAPPAEEGPGSSGLILP